MIMLLAAIFITARARQSGEAVSIGGFRSFVVATGSMEPSFRVDGLVIVRGGGFERVAVGDVVAFNAEGFGGQTALHRVVAVLEMNGERRFIVQGDNNHNPDGAAVTMENYIGRVVWNTNVTASYLEVLRRPWGWMFAVALPLMAIILLAVAIRLLMGSVNTWQGKALIISTLVFVASAILFILI